MSDPVLLTRLGHTGRIAASRIASWVAAERLDLIVPEPLDVAHSQESGHPLPSGHARDAPRLIPRLPVIVGC